MLDFWYYIYYVVGIKHTIKTTIYILWGMAQMAQILPEKRKVCYRKGGSEDFMKTGQNLGQLGQSPLRYLYIYHFVFFLFVIVGYIAFYLPSNQGVAFQFLLIITFITTFYILRYEGGRR